MICHLGPNIRLKELSLSKSPLISIFLLESDPEILTELVQTFDGDDEVKIRSTSSTSKALDELKDNYVDLLLFNFDRLWSSNNEEVADAPLDFLKHVRDLAPHLSILCFYPDNLSRVKANSLLEFSHHQDLFASGKTSPSIILKSRDDLVSVRSYVKEIQLLLKRINLITINNGGRFLGLKPLHQRILRTFVVKFGGESCKIEKISDGKSGAAVFKIVVVDVIGQERMHAIAKIDTLDRVNLEFNNYNKEVTRLPTGNYPTAIAQLPSPSSSTSSIFYRLLDNDELLSSVILSDSSRASNVVSNLSSSMECWHKSGDIRTVKIEKIRKILLSDDDLEKIVGKYPQLSWFKDLEDSKVVSRWGCSHVDLHGGNVFVHADNDPVLIDFADICEAPCALDPITLELSLFTHGPIYSKLNWLPKAHNLPWYNVDVYTADSEYELFIKSCRSWSHSIAGGDADVMACAYSYLIRQLKYPDINHVVILDLLHSVNESFNNSSL